ncbi:MAG: Fic family protein [Bacteroidales bacterium]|nr:Fic family protein [Bacteroidales bacterium]
MTNIYVKENQINEKQFILDLKLALEYDLEQERIFNYGKLSNDEKIAHISKFVANLWQIHAFPEGNTRTTAVFTIQYLRSLGFNVNNDVFAKHSWYFRNALVRYIYKNQNGIQPEPKFLERFFRNLLLGEKWVLKNRYLVINPPKEYLHQPRLDNPTSTQQVPNKYPTSTTQILTENTNIVKLVKILGVEKYSIKQIMELMKIKDRPNFLKVYLNPAILEGYITKLYPNSPRHPRQKYLLTIKGQMLLNSY